MSSGNGAGVAHSDVVECSGIDCSIVSPFAVSQVSWAGCFDTVYVLSSKGFV